MKTGILENAATSKTKFSSQTHCCLDVLLPDKEDEVHSIKFSSIDTESVRTSEHNRNMQYFC